MTHYKATNQAYALLMGLHTLGLRYWAQQRPNLELKKKNKAQPNLKIWMLHQQFKILDFIILLLLTQFAVTVSHDGKLKIC